MPLKPRGIVTDALKNYGSILSHLRNVGLHPFSSSIIVGAKWRRPDPATLTAPAARGIQVLRPIHKTGVRVTTNHVRIGTKP